MNRHLFPTNHTCLSTQAPMCQKVSPKHNEVSQVDSLVTPMSWTHGPLLLLLRKLLASGKTTTTSLHACIHSMCAHKVTTLFVPGSLPPWCAHTLNTRPHRGAMQRCLVGFSTLIVRKCQSPKAMLLHLWTCSNSTAAMQCVTGLPARDLV